MTLPVLDDRALVDPPEPPVCFECGCEYDGVLCEHCGYCSREDYFDRCDRRYAETQEK